MDENMKTGIPPSAVQEISVDEVRTNEDAVEAMAILGEEHVEAVASMGAAVAREETNADVSRTDESNDHGAIEGADEVLRADPVGTEDQPIEDQENGAHPEGAQDGQGELPEDEPGGAPEADAAEEKQSIVKKAIDKLKSWVAKVKDEKEQLTCQQLCSYLEKRCREDTGFAKDITNPSKTWNGLFAYMEGKAIKMAHGTEKCQCAMVSDNIVYEWAEDYIRKAEEKKKEPGKKSQKPGKNKTKSQEICTKPEENAQSATENAQSEQDPVQDAQEVEQKKPEEKPARAKKAKPKTELKKPKAEKVKPEKPKKEKKDKNEMDGQIDLFSLFG